MDTTVTDPLVGRLLDGRYRVESRLARGGMATVYQALDTRLDRPVALKVMHAGLAEDHAFVSRFIREARSAARLSHPGVVAVYDQGEDNGVVFLAMEYVAGRTLRDWLRERGRLTPREAFDVLEPMLSALAAAHSAGIVHRDIKPENVLLADDGRIKVADFGLARSALTSGGSAATQGVVMGTVAYLAPEQVELGSADTRSDVYSAGILLYEMLTGVPPYSGETPMAVAYQHVTSDVPAPSARVPGLADDLDVLVQTATDRDPDGRPDDAAKLLRMVQGVRSRLTPAQLAFAPTTVDLTQTMVVPLPGSGGSAGSAGTGWGGSAGSDDTAALDLGHQPIQATGYVPRPPKQPKVGGPGQVPTAARRQGGRRRLLIGLLLLALVTAGVGVGAWYLGSGRYVATPNVVSMERAAAVTKLAAAGLKVGTPDKTGYSETVHKGFVLGTDPKPGANVVKNGAVTLTISLGPERYDVPTLAGLSTADASTALAAVHLTLGARTTAYSNSMTAGKIISSNPIAGTPVQKNSAVSVVVSRGFAPVIVPDFTGMSLAQAQALASSKHLVVQQNAQQYSKTVKLGYVISQDTPPKGSVQHGTTINVVVSQGPPLVNVPNVIDKKAAQAIKILQAAGFKVQVQSVPHPTLDRVIDESPQGGSPAPYGSTVVITIV
jgi:beta-lactam-binding protein with PASTA domain/predicted Ser/Thr protein kinase